MKLKIFALVFLLVFCTALGAGHVLGAERYSPDVNYMKEIIMLLESDRTDILETGAELEKKRNDKIDGEGMQEEKTDYFSRLNTLEELLSAFKNGEAEPAYSQDDLYWLSRVIQAEAGGSWMPDWLQQGVGSVVLNRVASGKYPGSIKDVVFQTGQYACTDNGSIYQEPSQKAVENARYLLENGSVLPAGVLGQSEFIQGEIHSTYEDPYLATTTYFCYL